MVAAVSVSMWWCDLLVRSTQIEVVKSQLPYYFLQVLASPQA